MAVALYVRPLGTAALTPPLEGMPMGYVSFDYAKQCATAAQQIPAWIRDGRIKIRGHMVRGTVDDLREALQVLFRGENVGELVPESA
ncbi:hypothetical protein ABZ876_13115 [Streptomyces sp. NPDC046931]|uniref:hypothetical protein n=1 Tax=Streptomyces sp. NPDC046931 TaxID=3154806 RepID=UPI00340EAA8A